MDEYYSVIQFLPEPLRTELKAMPPERAARVQEIRLRAGQAVLPFQSKRPIIHYLDKIGRASCRERV